MKKANLLIILTFCLYSGISFFYSNSASANDEIEVTISTNSNVVALNDFLTLQVRVTGSKSGSAPKPVIWGLEEFSIVSQSSGTEVSIVNLTMTRSTTHTYEVTPKRSGVKTVLQAIVSLEGRSYTSNKIEIETLDASSGTGKGPSVSPFGRQRSLLDDFFGNQRSPFGGFGRRTFQKDDFLLQASTNKKSVYAGEEVVYSLRFYRKETIWSDAQYVHPEFNGFWTEQLPERERVSNGHENIGGVMYEASEMPVILYPLTDGKKVIGKGSIKFQPDTFSPPMRIESNEVVLDVLPLPREGKPDDFTGLVGTFGIEASIIGSTGAVAAAEAGKPVTLSVVVTGKGNIHAIPKPAEPEIDGFEKFEPEASDDFRRGTEGSIGTRTFKYILVPERSGPYEIGPFKVDYFDPATGTYKTAATKPIPITVTGSNIYGASGHPSDREKRNEVPIETIQEIKPNLAVLKDEGKPYYERIVFLLYPVILAAGFALVRYRLILGKEFLRRGPSPYEIGRARLDRAGFEISTGDKDIFFNEVYRGLAAYYSAKRGMPAEKIEEIISHDKLTGDDSEASKLIKLLDTCRTGKFSPINPGKEEMKKILDEADELLRSMEGMK